MPGYSQPGLFSPKRSLTRHQCVAFEELLSMLDEFTFAIHRTLVASSHDVLIKARLLRPYHQARSNSKTSRAEDYLQHFIEAFKNSPELQPTITLYRHLLLVSGQVRIVIHELRSNARQQPRNSIDSFVDSVLQHLPQQDDFCKHWTEQFRALTPRPESTLQKDETNEDSLTNQQEAHAQLQTTLVMCISNRMLKPRPSRDEDYQKAKLKLLWRDYQKEYYDINTTTLIVTAAQSITDAQLQMVTARHVEAQQKLAQQQHEYSPAGFQKLQADLQANRDVSITQIKSKHPKLLHYAKTITNSAQDMSSESAKRAFGRAVREVERMELAIAGSPALFNLCTSGDKKNPYASAMLQRIEMLQEMKAYRVLFIDQRAEIAAAAHEQTPAAEYEQLQIAPAT